ncbi:MAG: AgmX/PglI C-terminal domain-containing protein [Polyangiaceae bacterium]|nr:AgmX/PglI C-terminal domain-containing protein [Polyangiaceae bacterium]
MEVLSRVVGTRIERIRDCYQTMLHWTPELEGRFTVTFVINTDGTINEPVVENSNFAEPLVVTCVIQQFRGLVFPPPVGGPMTVNAPFRFKLRKPEP